VQDDDDRVHYNRLETASLETAIVDEMPHLHDMPTIGPISW